MARVSQTRTKISRVEGLENLDRKLQKLVEEVVRSDRAKLVNYSAGLEAQRILKAGAPGSRRSSSRSVWQGWKTSIADSIKISQSGMPVYVKQNRSDNPAGLWLEYGTAERKHKDGKEVGAVHPTNWWSKARNKSRAPVRKILREGYKTLVEDVARAR